MKAVVIFFFCRQLQEGTSQVTIWGRGSGSRPHLPFKFPSEHRVLAHPASDQLLEECCLLPSAFDPGSRQSVSEIWRSSRPLQPRPSASALCTRCRPKPPKESPRVSLLTHHLVLPYTLVTDNRDSGHAQWRRPLGRRRRATEEEKSSVQEAGRRGRRGSCAQR